MHWSKLPLTLSKLYTKSEICGPNCDTFLIQWQPFPKSNNSSTCKTLYIHCLVYCTSKDVFLPLPKPHRGDFLCVEVGRVITPHMTRWTYWMPWMWGVETLLLKTTRVGFDGPEDSFQDASPENTYDGMLMRTCSQMQERGRTFYFYNTKRYYMKRYRKHKRYWSKLLHFCFIPVTYTLVLSIKWKGVFLITQTSIKVYHSHNASCC